MATIDDLSVKVSAQTADFVAGIETAESQLDGLSNEAIQTAGALQLLSGRADSAGDNISQTGKRASATSSQLGFLSTAAQAANTSFVGLSATTWGSLIPAVIALSAALAPVIGALGGFIAVAGAIGGIGIAGVLGGIAANTKMLTETFNDLVAVATEEFSYALTLAGEVLNDLLREFTDIIPELVPAKGQLELMAGAFAELGSTIIQSLPAFVELATTLTTTFLPPFTDWLQDILPQLPGMIMEFVSMFERMLPRFMEAGRLMAELLPPFTEFGFTVLDVLGPALVDLAEAGTDVLEWINSLESGVQKLVAAGALLAPVVTTLGGLFGPAIISGAKLLLRTIPRLISGFRRLVGFARLVAGLLGAGGTLALALLTGIGLFVKFEDEIRATINRIEPIVANAFNSINKWLQEKGSKLLQKGMKALGEVLRAGAIELYNIIAKPGESRILAAISDVAGWLEENAPGILETAWDTIVSLALSAWEGFQKGLIGETGIIQKTITGIQNWIMTGFASLLVTGIQWANSFKNIFIDIWNFIIGGFGDAFNGILNTIESGLNGVIGLINDAINAIPWSWAGMSGPDQLSSVSVPEISSDFGQLERATTNREVIRERVTERIATVTVEDGEIVAVMQDEAQDVVDKEQRRTRERQGRSMTPR